MTLRRSPRRSPAPTGRGQSLIEFALVLPVAIYIFFGIYTFWLSFQQQQTYTVAAQTLAEWVGRSGEYDGDAMRTTIQSMLDDAVGVDSADTFLFIHVTEPDNSQHEIGTPVPAAGDIADPPDVPVDNGWASALEEIALGSTIRLDIWSYHRLNVPLLPFGQWIAPAGHAAFYELSDD
jgi:hypothetical protein